MVSLAGAIIGHLVGDYILQDDWMAKEKKRSSLVCALHALIWTMCVAVFSLTNSPFVCGVLFATHFIQDRWNFVTWFMEVNGQIEFLKRPLAPWSIIIVDNVFHLVVIWAVWVGSTYF